MYDLEADPHEQNNLLKIPEYDGILKAAQKELERLVIEAHALPQ